MKKQIWCLFLIAMCLLSGCRSDQSDSTSYQTIQDLKGQSVGVLDGTLSEDMLKEIIPDVEIQRFASITDMAVALCSGKIEAFGTDEYSIREVMWEYSGIRIVEEPYAVIPCAFAFPKTEKGRALRDEVSAFLRQGREDGTIAGLAEKWLSGKPEQYTDLDLAELAGNTPVLHVATFGSIMPYTFYMGGALTGYDLELVATFCASRGYGLEFHDISFGGIIPGLVSERYDFAASSMSVTEEREESVFFSEYTDLTTFVLAVRSDEAGESTGSFLDSLKSSFEKTFLRESRWKLILSGIWVTVYISLLSALSGTLLGFGLCILRRKQIPAVNGLIQVYVRILQGTPLLVLLMILYYVVFAKTSISAPAVAVIAFGMNFGAYVSEIMRSGIESIDRGQTEAALALGYTKTQAFFRIVLPQAAMQFLPVYKGEFIALVKMTSIVGYIAVQDLTKASDIIRSRTYEAFFPLITTAVLYFLIAGTFTLFLSRMEWKLKPDRKCREVKGIRRYENQE